MCVVGEKRGEKRRENRVKEREENEGKRKEREGEERVEKDLAVGEGNIEERRRDLKMRMLGLPR